MIIIFQLSDWFPKPMIWAIIVKFDQIRKNWWRISCAEILGKNFFAAPSVKKMSRFAEVSHEEIKRIAWKFTKTVIILGLAGYELITRPTASLVIYISSYPARPRRMTVNYQNKWIEISSSYFQSRENEFSGGCFVCLSFSQLSYFHYLSEKEVDLPAPLSKWCQRNQDGSPLKCPQKNLLLPPQSKKL